MQAGLLTELDVRVVQQSRAHHADIRRKARIKAVSLGHLVAPTTSELTRLPARYESRVSS